MNLISGGCVLSWNESRWQTSDQENICWCSSPSIPWCVGNLPQRSGWCTEKRRVLVPRQTLLPSFGAHCEWHSRRHADQSCEARRLGMPHLLVSWFITIWYQFVFAWQSCCTCFWYQAATRLTFTTRQKDSRLHCVSPLTNPELCKQSKLMPKVKQIWTWDRKTHWQTNWICMQDVSICILIHCFHMQSHTLIDYIWQGMIQKVDLTELILEPTHMVLEWQHQWIGCMASMRGWRKTLLTSRKHFCKNGIC